MKKINEVVLAQIFLLVCLVFFFVVVFFSESPASSGVNCENGKAVILFSSTGAKGFGHTAVLLQEYGREDWFYFSWQSPKVVFVKVPGEAMTGFDSFNAWVVNDSSFSGYKYEYDSSLVIRGNISSGLDEAERIFLRYVSSTGQDLDNIFEESFSSSFLNKNHRFNFVFNNCLDNVYEVLSKVLVNCEYYFDDLVKDLSIIPNIAKHQLISQLKHEEFW